MGKVTHTFAELEVSREVYLGIYTLLAEAGYHHAFIDGAIDMHGIALIARPKEKEEELDGINQVLSDFIEKWEGKR